MTRINALTFAIENLENAEVVEILTKLRDSEQKSADAKAKKTAERKTADEPMLEALVEYLGFVEKPVTCSDVVANVECVPNTSKATVLLKALIERGVVECVGDVKGSSGRKVKGYSLIAE